MDNWRDALIPHRPISGQMGSPASMQIGGPITRPLVRPPVGVAPAEALRLRYARVRTRSLQLAAPLSEEDCCAQSMADASPVKWHLAHTTWFFETFVLERFERRFAPFNPTFRQLFNSYYNEIGARHPRAERGLLTRPSAAEVRAYRRSVDARVQALLKLHDGGAAVRDLVTLGLQHEQQHQELILTDIKHLLAQNPLRPVYRRPEPEPEPSPGREPTREPAAAPVPLDWLRFDGGQVRIGHAGEGFAFDNERPRHVVTLAPYVLAARLVTNQEFLRFVDDGGYRTPRWWLAEGWDWITALRRGHPVYWTAPPQAAGAALARGAGGSAGSSGWTEFTLGGCVALQPDRPAVHLSYFEADAYARWAGARLPTEAEWEHAAATVKPHGNFAECGRFHPRAVQRGGLQQMFGDAWEWTASSYAPYPGYRTPAGAVGEYNGKFMVNQYVLRGGSCATAADHIRATYRNFFPATATWQFSGIRLARDLVEQQP